MKNEDKFRPLKMYLLSTLKKIKSPKHMLKPFFQNLDIQGPTVIKQNNCVFVQLTVKYLASMMMALSEKKRSRLKNRVVKTVYKIILKNVMNRNISGGD